MREVVLVDLDADEVDAEIGGGERRAAEAEEGIHQDARARDTVQPDAVLGHARRADLVLYGERCCQANSGASTQFCKGTRPL